MNEGIRGIIKKVLILAGIVALVFLAIYIVRSVVDNNPDKVAAQFMALLKKGDAQEGYKLASGKFKAKSSIDDWQQAVTFAANHYKSEPKFKNKQNDKSTQTLFYDVIVDDQDYTIRLTMAKDKLRWRVDTFESVPATEP